MVDEQLVELLRRLQQGEGSFRTVARRAGVRSPDTLARVWRREGRFGPETARRLAAAFGRSYGFTEDQVRRWVGLEPLAGGTPLPDGLARQSRPAPPHYAIVQPAPKVGSASAAWMIKIVPLVQQRVSASGMAPMDAESLPIAVPRDGNYVAVRVTGECMLPLIAPGDIVIVDQDAEAVPSDVCLVESEHEWTLKRLVRREGDHVELSPDNPAFPTISLHLNGTRILGVVQGVQKGKP